MPANLEPGQTHALDEPKTVPLRPASWCGLVARIQDGDTAAMEELYLMFSRGIRFYLCR